jgi:hypothetical protein
MNKTQLKQLIKEIVVKKHSGYKAMFKPTMSKLKKVGIDYSTVKVEGLSSIDQYAEDPDLTGAGITYAEWNGGTPLTDMELNIVNESDEVIDYIYKLAFK